jgi:replicative DNA helicase
VAATEHLLISKIIEDHSLQEAVRAGIKPAYFTSEWSDVYQWVLTYYNTHGDVPSEHAFSRKWGAIQVLDTRDESFSGLFDELLDKYRLTVMSTAMTDALAKMDNEDAASAVDIMRQAVQAASADSARIRDFNIVENWEERYARYEEMRNTPNALRGIPTGFRGLDKITHGLRPQQFIVLVGEPKRGKSLFALIMATEAHRAGKRPMFISFEMSVEEQLARFDALTAHVDYNNVLSGELSNAEMARIREQMILRKNMQPYIMSEDSSRLTTLSAIRAKIQEYQPDLLVIDGMYMMDDESGEPKGSPQALTNITRGTKALAQHFDIPILGTSQVLSWKINNKRTRAVTADSIGYTSSFVQDADLVLAAELNPDVDNQSIIRVVEARTAKKGTVHVNWDWSTMDFEEVEYADDDEFDPSYD